MTNKTVGYLNEIFSSIQGEGTRVGEQMTFLRLSGCALSCQWCDTPTQPRAAKCRIETPAGSEKFRIVSNPVTAATLNEYLAEFPDQIISITGGEPLDQVAFLENWLPTIHDKKTILLETAGIHTAAISRIIDWVDIVSMDIKLASSTGMKSFIDHHTAFLRTVLEKGHTEIYIKIVVASTTTDRDIQEAIQLVTSVNKYIPVIIQPASPTNTFSGVPSQDQVDSYQRLINAWVPNVKVIPQMHKVWDVL